MIRVLIVTHVRLYRDGLVQAIGEDARFVVAGTARTPFEAVESVQRSRADIALIDAMTVDLDSAVPALRAVVPDLRVLALAVPETEGDVVACAEAGASAIVTSDTPLPAMLQTMESVERGELLCTPRVAASLLHRVQSLSRYGEVAPAQHLTYREREVLQLIDQGFSNKEIAGALFIELGTVKNHVHNILNKLKVARRSEAARWARLSTPAGRRTP
jgi:DNA-binding NarL/FixJ family response regulator